MSRTAEQLERLEQIMARLRSPQGCPWDRAQDLRSLRPYLVEETYEVLEQMDHVVAGTGSWRALCEELGDLLFQIAFHARLAEEKGEFALADVAQAICDKIEFRHPHVFAGASAADANEVAHRWAQLKAEERRRKTGRPGSALDGVPREAPALARAERLTEKASRVKFDWARQEDVRAKVDEELAELDEAVASGVRERIEEELGDVLFALANFGRWVRASPEDALRGTLDRFIARFDYIEQQLRARGKEPADSTLEEMDALWNEAKARAKRP